MIRHALPIVGFVVSSLFVACGGAAPGEIVGAQGEALDSTALPQSQVRGADQSWQDAQARSTIAHTDAGFTPLTTDAEHAAVPYSQLNLSSVPDWNDVATLDAGFAWARDPRFIDDTPINRRESWLYPDDGCWARAALADERLGSHGYARPSKVFVFGNLTVTSPNTAFPGQQIHWWYHVAPLVKVGAEPKVLDPALDPYEPLPLAKWILMMVPALTEVTVAICDPQTYEPMTVCHGATAADESAALSDQQHFLPYEWQRQVALQRDPYQVLGDNPPWRP